MTGHLQTIDRRLLARRCVACGYDGALLRGGQATQCARCGCDLMDRPARSYAEMEGLVGQPMLADDPTPMEAREEGLIHRWITFLFFAMLFVLMAGFLARSAMALG
ncbi:MAG: hypothetical protein ACYTF9_04060 [Planctomycetota bacterium]